MQIVDQEFAYIMFIGYACKVLTNLQKMVMHLKVMTKNTEGNRYSEVLNSDCKKLAPKASRVVKMVEGVILAMDADDKTKEKEEADTEIMMYAAANKLVGFYAEFNEAEEWYGRFASKKPSAKGGKKKRKDEDDDEE